MIQSSWCSLFITFSCLFVCLFYFKTQLISRACTRPNCYRHNRNSLTFKTPNKQLTKRIAHQKKMSKFSYLHFLFSSIKRAKIFFVYIHANTYTPSTPKRCFNFVFFFNKKLFGYIKTTTRKKKVILQQFNNSEKEVNSTNQRNKYVVYIN